MSKSAYLEDALLNHPLGGPNYVRPATVHLALFNVAPTEPDGDAGTEVTGVDYARVAITNNATEFPAAASGSKSNANAIVFAAAGAGGWGTIEGWALFDASTGGNMMYFGEVTEPKPIAETDVARFDPGALVFTED